MQLFIRLVIAIVLLPFTAFAHGYWMEAEGSHKIKEPVTVKLFFGEYIAGERLSGEKLDRMKDIKVYVATPGGEKQEVIMQQLHDYWEGTFTPQAEGAYEITGINDTREVQDWTKHDLGITRPIQYLKTSYLVGNNNAFQPASLFLDANIHEISKRKYEVLLTKNKLAVPSEKVTVTEYNGEAKDLVTDKDGKASFTLDKPGVYLIGVEWIDKTPGTFKDKPYETVRHKLDVSLYVL